MSEKFYVFIAGGVGPDVWEDELEIVAADFEDAAGQARAAAEERGGAVYEISPWDVSPRGKEKIDCIIREVCELPDRTSPESQPNMMLVSTAELEGILSSHIRH